MKKLTKTGNSLAIVIDRPLLERLGIDDETQLDVSTDGHVILISPVRDKRREQKLKAVLDDADSRYAGVFKKLAE